MRALVQRVSTARVLVDGRELSRIGSGLLVLLGIGRADDAGRAEKLAAKVANLRVFSEGGKFARSLLDVRGAVLVVSQFTLYADTSRGRRPGFEQAALPEAAEPLYRRFMDCLQGFGLEVAGGEFGAHMLVESANDGPVTIMLEV